MEILTTSNQINECKNNETIKGTKQFRSKNTQLDNQKEKSQPECKKDSEGTNQGNSKAISKKKSDEYEANTIIKNIVCLSLSIVNEELQFNCQQQIQQEQISEHRKVLQICDQEDIDSFQLPPTDQQFPQQKQKSHKKTKNRKNKKDPQARISKNQTLTQKQQPQQPPIQQQSKEKQFHQLSPQESNKIKQQIAQSKTRKQPSITQIEKCEQENKKDSADFDAQFSHIGARSTTAGNSQSESDDCLQQSDENKQSAQKLSSRDKPKKKNYNNNGEKVGDKQYPHSTQTTPIKRKKLNLTKSKTHDIDELSSAILQKSYQNRIRKQICLNRLNYLIYTNYHLNMYPYGSFETGLDLEISDVDVGVWGSQNLSYAQIVSFLQLLNNTLKQTPFLIKSKLIQGQMPILKLELNPKSGFYDEDQHIQQNWSYFHLDHNDQGRIIQVDITWIYQSSNVYNNPHLGFASTTIVKDWIHRFVWYRDIMLILKQLVKSKNLNDAHTGGISSFCLSIMLAAIYMCKHYTQNDKKQILLDFLKKYGTQFDPLKEGIYIDSYGQQHPFIALEECPPYNPLTIYSPINYQIISQKAHRFLEIQEEFKQFYEHLTKSNKIQDYFDFPLQVNQPLFI
ncbi:unnamed protein product (macronuclear) [Paramecium tetraurelia]|uniref:Poly(A) RNA polymerase mitochondrial-like central palm domain-containing protein n=1 Tax=Paramecium tetraurelia TaxID=5888 RepID=A0CU21_PARTE|nr:uncharacterized protein GSPATT00010487001 [Paramecium tetraurelia]CAK74288.1 unnamed protein product [Paramecium tetraurelia]|eukprot:XP_001441685.1 hypothetical protein (macronuclear) [Paramecium tetraurelia strain d4-2]